PPTPGEASAPPRAPDGARGARRPGNRTGRPGRGPRWQNRHPEDGGVWMARLQRPPWPVIPRYTDARGARKMKSGTSDRGRNDYATPVWITIVPRPSRR